MTALRYYLICLLLPLVGSLACSNGGFTPAYNFNGDWQTSDLIESSRSGDCVALLKEIPIRFPAFSYHVDQVGENITLRDDTGELTGADRGDGFSVTDEREVPGEEVDPALLEPPYSGDQYSCRVTTQISYQGESETSGTIRLRFDFTCVERATGNIVASCELEYTGTSGKITSS